MQNRNFFKTNNSGQFIPELDSDFCTFLYYPNHINWDIQHDIQHLTDWVGFRNTPSYQHKLITILQILMDVGIRDAAKKNAINKSILSGKDSASE